MVAPDDDDLDPQLAAHWTLLRELALRESAGLRAINPRERHVLADLHDWGYAVRSESHRAYWLPTAQGVAQYYKGPWKVDT